MIGKVVNGSSLLRQLFKVKKKLIIQKKLWRPGDVSPTPSARCTLIFMKRNRFNFNKTKIQRRIQQKKTKMQIL